MDIAGLIVTCCLLLFIVFIRLLPWVKLTRRLDKINDTRTIEVLIEALEDRTPHVRKKAIEVLREIGSARVIQPLIRMLGDRDLGVREKAEDALEQIGLPAVPLLIKALHEEDRLIQYGAATTLGRLGDVRGVKPLINVVLKNKDWELRDIAVEALAKIGSSAAKVLIDILGEIDSYGHSLDEIAETLEIIFSSIDTISFGDDQHKESNQRTILHDPDVSKLTIAMPNLERIIIYTETYNFHQVERFITYAVNYIGQKYLKENVEVHIYGNTDNFHPNLLNNFKNLCKFVEVHEKKDYGTLSRRL